MITFGITYFSDKYNKDVATSRLGCKYLDIVNVCNKFGIFSGRKFVCYILNIKYYYCFINKCDKISLYYIMGENMDAQKGNIFDVLNGNKQFIIPVYQRYYSWEIEQCSRLWKDIVDMQLKHKDGHFVGAIVNIAEKAMPTGVQKYMIIDGQQRMTTLTLLLIALRDFVMNTNGDFSVNADKINNVLLKNEYEAGDERYKLLLSEMDRELLISMIEQKPYERSEDHRIIKNYNYFLEQIAGGKLKPSEVYESLGKLLIVNITLSRESDDAQAIFESLNSTGKELSESDLIRNYVLMGLNNNEQLYVHEHMWRPMELLFEYEKRDSVMDKFFRDYLTMRLSKIPKISRVYEEFKLYYSNMDFETIKDLSQDLYECAKFYTNMVFCRGDNKELKSLYEDIGSLKMEVSYPFFE